MTRESNHQPNSRSTAAERDATTPAHDGTVEPVGDGPVDPADDDTTADDTADDTGGTTGQRATHDDSPVDASTSDGAAAMDDAAPTDPNGSGDGSHSVSGGHERARRRRPTWRSERCGNGDIGIDTSRVAIEECDRGVARRPHGLSETVVAHELDHYAPSFGYKAVRLGLGSGPNIHRRVTLEGVVLQSVSNGFPVAGQYTVPDDRFLVALSVCAPPRTRWSEHDFSAGTMLSFGPNCGATWVNPEGVSIQIAHVDRGAVELMAATLRARVRLPEPGAVVCLSETVRVRRMGRLLASLGNPLDTSVVLPDSSTELLAAVTDVFAEPARRAPRPAARRIDGRRLISTCVDYADEVGGRPSVPELCSVANVSERRLRQAFHDAFDMGPLAFFRLRSLNLARNQLLEPGTSTVTDVAFRLGWRNLGRFARHYQHVFGEMPSDTIATTRAPVRTAASTTFA